MTICKIVLRALFAITNYQMPMVRQTETIVVDVGVNEVLKMSRKGVFDFLSVIENAEDFAVAIAKIIVANSGVTLVCRFAAVEDETAFFRDGK